MTSEWEESWREYEEASWERSFGAEEPLLSSPGYTTELHERLPVLPKPSSERGGLSCLVSEPAKSGTPAMSLPPEVCRKTGTGKEQSVAGRAGSEAFHPCSTVEGAEDEDDGGGHSPTEDEKERGVLFCVEEHERGEGKAPSEERRTAPVRSCCSDQVGHEAGSAEENAGISFAADSPVPP